MKKGGCEATILSERNIKKFLSINKGRFSRSTSKGVSKICGRRLYTRKVGTLQTKWPLGVTSEKLPNVSGQ